MPYLLPLTLLISPLYVWRFNLFGIPVNFLMLWVFFVWLIFALWLWRTGRVLKFARYKISLNRTLLTLIVLFFLAGLISLFVGGLSVSKLAQFVVLFLQPLSIFLIANFISQEQPNTKSIFLPRVYGWVAIVGALALVQYFTLKTLPSAYWGNSAEPKRALGFFAHPDMFGLFLAPLLSWLVPDLLRRLNDWRQKINLLALAAWLLGGVGLLLSLSRGAWFGFAAAVIAGVIVAGRRKYWAALVGAIVAALLVIAVVPNFRYRLILPFKGEKSSSARLSLWHTGEKMIKDSPILGQGLTGFGSNWYKYNTDPNLDHYNFPHNIVLNFWVDTGLLGLLSFLGLLLYGWWYGWKNRSDPWALGLALFLVALSVHGLIDTPYLKNDLAVIFWLIWGASWSNHNRV